VQGSNPDVTIPVGSIGGRIWRSCVIFAGFGCIPSVSPLFHTIFPSLAGLHSTGSQFVLAAAASLLGSSVTLFFSVAPFGPKYITSDAVYFGFYIHSEVGCP
jgi:hypothetical protein